MCSRRTVLPVALASGEGPCWMLNCWWINMEWPVFKAAMTNEHTIRAYGGTAFLDAARAGEDA